MFVRFTDMVGLFNLIFKYSIFQLAYTEWSDRALEAIIRHATDFVMFLSKNHQEFFNVDEVCFYFFLLNLN